MALEFRVINLKKDLDNRHYLTRIEFQGRQGNYEIRTNANIRYLDWINQLSILNGFDCAFQKDNNGGVEGLYLKINEIDSRAQKCEKDLEKAIIEFIRKECCEK